ncbi:MAG: hypothetical protein N4A40_10695 [Tissierellales bacterium]|jgi:hypothetical protein|nr:hypothetical protein [Tissierellales bacterium]
MLKKLRKVGDNYSGDVERVEVRHAECFIFEPKEDIILELAAFPYDEDDVNIHIYPRHAENSDVIVIDSNKELRSKMIKFEKGATYELRYINKSRRVIRNGYIHLNYKKENQNVDPADARFDIKNLRIRGGDEPGDSVGVQLSYKCIENQGYADARLKIEYAYKNGRGYRVFETKLIDDEIYDDGSLYTIRVDLGELTFGREIVVDATIVDFYSGEELSDCERIEKEIDTNQIESVECITDNPIQNCNMMIRVKFKNELTPIESGDLKIVLKVSGMDDVEVRYKPMHDNIMLFRAKTKKSGKVKVRAYIEMNGRRVDKVEEYIDVEIAPDYAGEEFTDNILKGLVKDTTDVAAEFMTGCYEITVNTLSQLIDRIRNDDEEHKIEDIARIIGEDELLNFGNVARGLMEFITILPSIKSIAKTLDLEMEGNGVIGIVTDIATGGALSVGGAIGIFADIEGNARIMVTGSLGLSTPDYDLFPAVMYYPTMPSMEPLEGVGFNLDLGFGDASVSTVIGEDVSIGVDILPLLCSGSFKIANNDVKKFFKAMNLNYPKAEAALTVGYTKTIFSAERN